MKSAVVYYSMSGNAEFVAKRVCQELGADEIRLVPKKEYPNKGFKKFLWGGKSAMMGEKPPLEEYAFSGEYDLVVLGTPVWAGTFTPPIGTFLSENKERLAGKKIAAFTCSSGGGGEKTLEKIKKEFGIDAFCATLVLTDPLAKPDGKNDVAISEFCQKIR